LNYFLFKHKFSFSAFSTFQHSTFSV